MTRISLLVVALFGLVATMASPARATTPPARVPLDLAAIPLAPAEIEAVGLEDYGTDYGWLLTRDEAVREVAAFYGVPRDEFETTMVDGAGLTRYYTVRTARPVERGDAGTVATGVVFTDVYEFASAEGAAAAEDYLVEIATPEGAETVAGTRDFGDSSRIVRHGEPDGENGDRVDAMALFVRTGTLIVELDVEDIVRDGEGADPPVLAQVEALGERLMGRIEEVRTGELPNLGSRMVRLGTEGEVYISADRYEVLNGQVVRHFNKPVKEHEYLQDLADEGGVIDRYIVFQDIVGESYEWTRAPGTMIKLDHLAGEAEAKAWFASARERIGKWSVLESIEPVDRQLFLGDQAVAYAFTIDFGGGLLSGHLMVIRSGQDVFEARAYAPDGSSLATVATIAKAQLDCLRGFRCLERLSVPEELKAAA